MLIPCRSSSFAVGGRTKRITARPRSEKTVKVFATRHSSFPKFFKNADRKVAYAKLVLVLFAQKFKNRFLPVPFKKAFGMPIKQAAVSRRMHRIPVIRQFFAAFTDAKVANVVSSPGELSVIFHS
jgi:hypothetical protein